MNGSKNQDDLLKIFEAFDKNGDKLLSVEEIMEACSAYGEVAVEAEVREAIAQADRNGDGKLDYEEFVKYFHINP